MILAIDGPAGAGKSTISKMIANELGFACLDTGAMYRSIAWAAINAGVPFDDDEALGLIARTHEIEFVVEPGDARPRQVLIAGTDVTDAIRTAEIDRAVSPVAASAAVRAALLGQQRRIGYAGDYVVEGRDIGTVVFPDAEVKVFLTASADERARRRVAQNEERGIGDTDFEAVRADIIARDEYDSTREVAPLRQAEDAILVDSSHMTIDEVVAHICGLVRAMQAEHVAEEAR